MTDRLDLDNVGNVDSNCRYLGKRRVEKVGTGLFQPQQDLVLKLYEMSVQGKPILPQLIGDCQTHLERLGEQRKLRTGLGLGFAIISNSGYSKDGFVNVIEWGNYPISAVTQSWTIRSGGKIRNPMIIANPIDIAEDGPFCIHEISILAHEAKAWEIYLATAPEDRSAADKQKYLDNFFTGWA